MNYLLDADTVIDMLRRNGEGFKRFEKVKNETLYLSIIAWIEIEYGIKKAVNREKKQNLFDDLLFQFKIEILPLDLSIGNRYLDVKLSLEKIKTPLENFDLLIAATALVHNLTLVTGNLSHFKRIKELKILN